MDLQTTANGLYCDNAVCIYDRMDSTAQVTQTNVVCIVTYIIVAQADRSANTWNKHHPTTWKDATIVGPDTLHIHLTPEDQHFNRDMALELPGC